MATSPLSNRILYSDFRSDFAINPVSSDLARKTNEEAVKESIRNLLLTDKGERLFQPDIGSDLRTLLFEPLTPDTMLLIRQQVEDTINNYEPRANLIDVQVTGSLDNGSVEIAVVFNVINIERPISLSVTLTRVR